MVAHNHDLDTDMLRNGAELAVAAVRDYLLFADDSWLAIIPHALRMVARLGIADLVADGPRELAGLAEITGTNIESLGRLLRTMATVGVFREVEPSCFALGPVGARLCTGASDSVRASVSHDDSQRAWLTAATALRTGAPSFGDGQDFFDHKAADRAAGAAFANRMRERAGRLYAQVVEMIDWADSRVVLDIGGADGFLLSRILAHEPRLTGILCDRAAVEPASPGSRCTTVREDFFLGVPRGADTHLLCSVLHDWSDDAAGQILRNSRKAIGRDGRLLIVEMLMPAGDEWHPARWSDLSMMVLTGGRERTVDEFERLLRDADYELVAARPVPDSWFALIEAR